MAMEELLAVQELEKRLAEQYAEAQAEAKKRIAVELRACWRTISATARWKHGARWQRPSGARQSRPRERWNARASSAG